MFTPTAEQTLIRTAVAESDENLIITARAGAAKTTTLCMIAEDVAPLKTLCVAFNKKIAEELTGRLPETATAKTINAIGHKAWWGFTRKKLSVSSRKNYDLISSVAANLDDKDKEEVYDNLSEYLQLIREAKTAGYLPPGTNPMAKPLISPEDFLEEREDFVSNLQMHLLPIIMKKNFAQALEGFIDFDDQIYLPAIMPCSFDEYPLIMVDEAQDLSKINQVLLGKLAKAGRKASRIIAVGDPCQAIYGFRGALGDSMTTLAKQFSMRNFYLTICFRSAESIVRNAQWRAPDMQWRPGAPMGIVKEVEKWTSDTIQDGDAVICRNNAPLFSLALKLIRDGRYPETSAGDVVANLDKIMKKFGPDDMTVDEAERQLFIWKEGASLKTKNQAKVQDQAECIMLFLENASTLGEARKLLERITQCEGRVKLMTGHKSKGLEFDRVFFLDKYLIKKEGQDPNIRYVIETRAREELYYVESKKYSDEDVVGVPEMQEDIQKHGSDDPALPGQTSMESGDDPAPSETVTQPASA